MRRALLLTLVALAGIAVAVVITMAASRLTSEDIGLNSEPLTAGSDLAPAITPLAHTTATTPPGRRTSATARTTSTSPALTTPTTTAPAPTATTPVDGDDHGGHRRGSDGDGYDD